MNRKIITDNGVSHNSTIIAYTASEFAKQALFFPIMSGHYHCNKDYYIERDYMDMFLIFYVRKGKLACSVGEKIWTLIPDDFLIIDCKKPHRYFALDDDTEFQWLHFDGNSSQHYFDNNLANKISRPTDLLSISLNNILQMMEESVLDEHECSIYIHTILKEIYLHSRRINKMSHPISYQVISIINENFRQNISVKSIAEQLNISQYYLIRILKEDTGYTPYEYLQQVRIRRAMEYLMNADITITDIAFDCGYSSVANFSRSFKKETDISPSSFRKQHLGKIFMKGNY